MECCLNSTYLAVYNYVIKSTIFSSSFASLQSCVCSLNFNFPYKCEFVVTVFLHGKCPVSEYVCMYVCSFALYYVHVSLSCLVLCTCVSVMPCTMYMCLCHALYYVHVSLSCLVLCTCVSVMPCTMYMCLCHVLYYVHVSLSCLGTVASANVSNVPMQNMTRFMHSIFCRYHTHFQN